MLNGFVRMQDCEACNAGHGSNLTEGGVTECDASVMDESGAFGAVGAVPGAATCRQHDCGSDGALVMESFTIVIALRNGPNTAHEAYLCSHEMHCRVSQSVKSLGSLVFMCFP